MTVFRLKPELLALSLILGLTTGALAGYILALDRTSRAWLLFAGVLLFFALFRILTRRHH